MYIYCISAVADYYRQISKLNKHVRDVLSDLATESDVSHYAFEILYGCLLVYAPIHVHILNIHTVYLLGFSTALWGVSTVFRGGKLFPLL